jgi:hypothetical protein
MKRSATGERLWRDMRVTVCLPEQKDIVWRNHAKPRQGWTVEALDNMLAQAANYVEKKYPSIEFRLVELAPNDHKLIYAGRKADGMDNRRTAKIHEGVHAAVAWYPEECSKTPFGLSQSGFGNAGGMAREMAQEQSSQSGSATDVTPCSKNKEDSPT